MPANPAAHRGPMPSLLEASNEVWSPTSAVILGRIFAIVDLQPNWKCKVEVKMAAELHHVALEGVVLEVLPLVVLEVVQHSVEQAGELQIKQ